MGFEEYLRLNLEMVAKAARSAGLPIDDLTQVAFHGGDPIFASAYHLGEGAAVALSLVGHGANRLWVLRGGTCQSLSIDVRHAAASLNSFGFVSLAQGNLPAFQAPALTNFFQCGDGRWIHLHAGFDEGQKTLELLGRKFPADRDDVSAFTDQWNAFELEQFLGERGLCGAVARSASEWASSPQGQWLSRRPAVEIIRIGDAPPEPLISGARPLSGIRVLDLTRVLAGPACARTLAEHGADVLHIASPNLPTFDRFEMDTGQGKRQAYLDLTNQDQSQNLRVLAASCDVFSQGFRLGALARRAFGPENLAELRPGIIYVSETCYGVGGPWGERPGWEQLAQAATGIATAHGGEVPALIPAAFNDYTTGYLAAAGVMEALRRRAVQGGSWHVRVSLAQTSAWYQSFGCDLDPTRATGLGDVEPFIQKRLSGYGEMGFLAPALGMSQTPPHWDLPSMPLGSGSAKWLARSGYPSGIG